METKNKGAKLKMSAELQALLDAQAAVSDAQTKVQSLQAVVDQHNEQIASTNARRPSTAARDQEIEDVQAAMALGTMTAAEAETAEERIRAEIAKITEDRSAVDREISRLEATRNGVQRIFDTAKANLADLEAAQDTALTQFLEAEAGRAYANYLNAVRAVKDAWLRADAADSISSRGNFTRTHTRWGAWYDIYLPLMLGMESAPDMEHPMWPTTLFSPSQGHGPKAREAMREIVRQAMLDSGVEGV